MTRATRFALALLLAAVPTAQLRAQTYPSASPQRAQPGAAAPQGQIQQPQSVQTQPAQPGRASVYGPAVGAAQQQPAQQQPTQYGPAQNGPAQVQPAQGQVQPGMVRPAAGQQPIRQPGAAGADPNQPGVQLPNVPRVQVVAPMPQQPEWYPLDPKVEQWVDTVLRYWEERSNKVKTLECKFQKWEYDPAQIPGQFNQLKVLGKINEMPFTKYAQGTIKYGAPDKGLFKVEQLQVIIPGQQQNGKQKYEVQPKENGEHWITDGKRVFAFDAHKKEVVEKLLPPELQGKALADGPLPFMFGARAETIKARYWIRPLQPEAPGEYCLEAVPKSRQDSANFKMVQIVLDEKQYLPTKMQIFESDWSPVNPHRTAYRFDDRVENDQNALNAILNPLNINLNPWAKQFFEVAVPRGWKKVVIDANGNIAGANPANAAAVPGAGPNLK